MSSAIRQPLAIQHFGVDRNFGEHCEAATNPSEHLDFEGITGAIRLARWTALNELLHAESLSVQFLLPLNLPPQPPPRQRPPLRQQPRPLAQLDCAWHALVYELFSVSVWMLALFLTCAALWTWV